MIFLIVIYLHCYVTMIHFAFLLRTFFQPEYLGNNTSLTPGIFLKMEKLMTLKTNFKKCESFDVAYLQLRIELHWSWAFLN